MPSDTPVVTAVAFSPDQKQADRLALEAFVNDNADLETLERLLDQFNMFEAVGFVRQELRHSDFLAFLLDPRQNHRLGDAFVRTFLEKILSTTDELVSELDPRQLIAWDLSRATVRREWQFIDILVVDRTNRLVVVIENKVDTTEHSGQLERYLDLVRAEYPPPRWRHLAVYLTPDGALPSMPDYVAASYGLVADAVLAVAERQWGALDPVVHTLIIHYAQLLRRHIVADSEIADLCQSIYRQHQRALDLIFEHRPDRLAEVNAILLSLINSAPELNLDASSKQIVRFGHADWNSLPNGEGWTPSGRMLLFTFDSYLDHLDLGLWVGPGPPDIRRWLIELAATYQPPYRVAPSRSGATQRFTPIYKRHILTSEDYQDAVDMRDIEGRISEQWAEFLDRDLPALVAPIRDAASSLVSMSPESKLRGSTTVRTLGEADRD